MPGIHGERSALRRSVLARTLRRGARSYSMVLECQHEHLSCTDSHSATTFTKGQLALGLEALYGADAGVEPLQIPAAKSWR